jgi:hypothetical protein
MMKPKYVVIVVLLVFAGVILLALSRNSAIPKSLQATNEALMKTNARSANQNLSESLKDRTQIATEAAEKLQAKNQQDLDDIRDAIVKQEPEKIVQKLQSTDTEVRKEAVLGLRSLNYTNAIPDLQIALSNTEDIREKVAILEAIEYLQLPDATMEEQTNSLPVTLPQKPAIQKTN